MGWRSAAGGHSLYHPKLVLEIPWPRPWPASFASGRTSAHEISDLFSYVIATAKQIMKRFSLGAIQVLFLPTDQQELFVGHGLIPRIDFPVSFFNPGYRDRDEFDARFHPSGATSSSANGVLRKARESKSARCGQNSFARSGSLCKACVRAAPLDGGQAGVGAALAQ